MAESSNRKPEQLINMKLTPSSKLLHSIEALSDGQFNPSGLGRLDITHKGLEITVCNANTRVLGNLHLKPPGLILHCSKPIVRKLIDVASIFKFVSGSTVADDTVIIFHYEGSNELTFVLGSNADEQHNVLLREMHAKIERFPAVELFCEAGLTAHYLRKMVDRIQQSKMSQVSVSIEENLVTYLVGKHALWAKFGENGSIGTSGVGKGEIHRGMFLMPHSQAMIKASYVAPSLVVSFLGKPTGSVMMRFGLNEANTLGDLVFIYKADWIVFNYQDKKESSSEEEARSGFEEASDYEDMAFQPYELKYLGLSVGPSDSSLSESSNPIPEKVIHFQLDPASKLLNSALALSDSEFNPTAMGRVDITETGFEITVCDTKTGVPANLHLNPSGLINFRCSKPIVGKFINFRNIFRALDGVSDDDIVTIFHLDGSDDLTFILGSSPGFEYKVKLLELDAQVEKIPDITLFSEAVLTSDVLRRMITQLKETGITQQVLVNIAEKFVTYIIGKKSWVFTCRGDKPFGGSGTAPGMIHRAWFILHHLQAMRHASALGPYLVVCILSEPADSVMIRFCLRELGNLVFIYKAERIAPNCPEEIRSALEGSDFLELRPAKLEYLGFKSSHNAYTVREVLPFTLNNETIALYWQTTDDSSYFAELSDSLSRQDNRDLIRKEFRTIMDEALPSMKHLTVMAVFMDPKREAALEILSANFDAEKMLRCGKDSITTSRRLFEKAGHSFLRKAWIYAKCLFKGKKCPVEVSDAFLMEDPIGDLWDDPDVLNKGLRATEVFVSIVGYFDGEFDDVSSMQSFFLNLDPTVIDSFKIYAAPGKIVVPGQ